MENIRGLIIQILLCFTLAVFAGTPSWAKTLYLPEDASSLEQAVEMADKGDVIVVSQEAVPDNIRDIPAGAKSLTIAVDSMELQSKGIGPKGCGTENFEGFVEGIAITNQVPGVTISVVGNSCGGDPPPYMRIDRYNWLGVSSNDFASKVIAIDPGCDFSPEHVRMIFDDRQKEVSFDLGPWDGTYYIRAYNATTGGTPVMTRTVTIPGTGFMGVRYPIRMYRSSGDIRRIEIEESMGQFEAIDNLTFGVDHTPPEVAIESPAPLACVCGTVSITGTTCDPDGGYDRDRLEYRRVYPNADADWVLIKEFVNSPVCSSGSLYSWDTTADSNVVDGVYQLRVTATNDCGLTTSKEVTVYVDNDFSTVDFDSPTDIVGGSVCFGGTVWDLFCFKEYQVDYRPASGGSWIPVNEPVYDSSVTNDPFAAWKYPAGTKDGDYQVRVTGETKCGSSKTKTRTFTLDNTSPIAEISSPVSCTDPGGIVTFMGTAYDENMYQWVLDYWDHDAGRWSDPINKGNASVKNGVLGTWTRDMGSGCPDVVRLRVWDNVKVNTCSSWGPDRHRSEAIVVLKKEGATCRGDYNGDGFVDGSDLAEFAAEFGGACP